MSGWLCPVTVLALGWSQQADPVKAQPEAQSRQPGNPFQAAMKLEPSSREAALKNLVKTANNEVATSAMMALIALRAADTEALGLEMLPKLADQHNILGAVERTREFHLRTSFARDVLQRIADAPALTATPHEEEGWWHTAGLAATLLATSTASPDRALIERVARAWSHDPELWLAMAKLGFVEAQDVTLAHSVLQDTQAPGWARLASAAALAPSDSTAKAFVTNALTNFLTTTGQLTAESIVGDTMRHVQEKPGQTKFADLRSDTVMIGILEFMQTPDAERLTFEFLDATNLWVRTALGLVAAMRWPERFLETLPLHPDEYTKLRAALSIFHPDLLPRVQALVPPADLEKWRSKMLNDGIETVFSLLGNAGLIF
jgi:hypothetical protein